MVFTDQFILQCVGEPFPVEMLNWHYSLSTVLDAARRKKVNKALLVDKK